MRTIMDALQKLLNYTDPDASEYTPVPELVEGTPADAIQVQPATDDGCWETWSGTHYPTLDSVPWQAQGSATPVQCDGTGKAHS